MGDSVVAVNEICSTYKKTTPITCPAIGVVLLYRNNEALNINFSILFPCNSYSVTLSRCQISSTYCWIVLSEVNLPEQATFKIALFAQPSVSR